MTENCKYFRHEPDYTPNNFDIYMDYTGIKHWRKNLDSKSKRFKPITAESSVIGVAQRLGELRPLSKIITVAEDDKRRRIGILSPYRAANQAGKLSDVRVSASDRIDKISSKRSSRPNIKLWRWSSRTTDRKSVV